MPKAGAGRVSSELVEGRNPTIPTVEQSLLLPSDYAVLIRPTTRMKLVTRSVNRKKKASLARGE